LLLDNYFKSDYMLKTENLAACASVVLHKHLVT